MFNKSWSIAKLNLRTLKVPYLVTILVFATQIIQTLIYMIIAVSVGGAGNQMFFGMGSYFWLAIVMAAIFIPLNNFRKVVNLGGKRGSIFWGNLITYVLLAAVGSVVCTVFYYTVDAFLASGEYCINFTTFMQNPTLANTYYVNVSLIDIFGWGARGPFFVLVQQFVFLLLLGVLVHTFAAIQSKWYGWVTDAVLGAILSTFIPIQPLRTILLGFFDLTIFSANAFVQMAFCLVLAAAVYALNKPIFARKAI